MGAHVNIKPDLEPTLEEIKECRLVVAELMTRLNRPQFAPILNRLNEEVRKREENNDAMALAQEIINDSGR